jgi:hypothetical protein
MEHRWGTRAPVNVAVTLQLHSGALKPGRIANLSLSGALVRTEARLRPLSRVVVMLSPGDSEEGSLEKVAAYVVRETLGGVGIEWSEFAPPAICALLAEATATRVTPKNIAPYPGARLPVRCSPQASVR